MNVDKLAGFVRDELLKRDVYLAANKIRKYFAEEIESMLGDASHDMPAIRMILETRNNAIKDIASRLMADD
jgi:hypothetical protein